MNITIKATNMELTPAIREYAESRVSSLEKFIKNKDPEGVHAAVEVGKTTNHHKNGDIYRAELHMRSGGLDVFAFSEKEDLYAAIDDMRLDAARKLNDTKDRKYTLFIRGARSVKKMIKGISARNPFTSKSKKMNG